VPKGPIVRGLQVAEVNCSIKAHSIVLEPHGFDPPKNHIPISAFVGTNPTSELITSGLPVTRPQSSSNALENQSDELFRAHKATAPLCIGGGCGLGSDNFV
jgi:hypothetical protein